MKTAEKSARTTEEAIAACLSELGGVSREEAEIEILEEPGKGLFGLFGARQARVRVSVPEPERAPAESLRRWEKPASGSNTLPPEEREMYSPEEREALNRLRGETAQDFLRRLLKAMAVEAEMEVFYRPEGIQVKIVGQNLGILIGRRGETLDALQFLTNLAVSRRTATRARVHLDVGGYRQKREETLTELALRLADKVKRSGNRVTLEPMNPQERRVIHTALQNEWRLSTFSEGEEPNRHVVIAPKRSGMRPE
ncbi:MAG: protein jag [Gracilibacteraceae bacterium]|jgi:spoIIIJ-associated protein|nr:protein jag [Gracilibacteraceae bacterium]